VRRHIWISSEAFAHITGIRHICMTCGIGVTSKRDEMAMTECPGKRAVQTEGAKPK
jgi:hypothetical protein